MQISNKIKFPSKVNLIRSINIFIIVLFCLFPLITLLMNISGEDIKFILNDNNFYDALFNSFIYTFISSLITVILALIVGYFLNRSNIKHKSLFVLLFTIPMLIPTISVGLGIRVLFGTNGFMDQLFTFDKDMLGLPGLILGSVIVSFPPTFLILYDALRYEDKNPYDAASIMGIGSFSTFFKLTLPYIKKPLITAFFASFTLIFSDYGIPMEVAGKVETLPMYLYEQIISVFKYGRGAFVGLFLLMPALISFIVDIFCKDNNSEENHNALIKKSKRFNTISVVVCIAIVCFLSVPTVSFTSLAFMKGYPSNISFSMDNLSNIFKNTYGVGLLKYIINSITIAILTGIIGTIMAFLTAYFSTRIEGKMGRILHFISISSIAIPGIVLGVGYIFLFKNTNGWFYGTMIILILVNVAHFFGSPYIMARNCFSKMNKEYEIVGESLGINRTKIFVQVLIPNSIGTIIEMFSYFFLNSMITISAVAFLCTYKNQPLSILITTFEKTGNYEMQAVVSLSILLINIIFKVIFKILNYLLELKLDRKVKEDDMSLNKYKFDLLTFLEKNGQNKYSQKYLSDILRISVNTLNRELNMSLELGYVQLNAQNELSITDKGVKALEPYKVRKAIIFAAGFGSRMAPVTLDIPKPLVKVNGVRIIDTLLDALVEKGITNIIIVRGYLKEKFDELLEKYPFIKFVDNQEFNITNNISSAVKAIDYIDRCYICEADLVVSNKDIIRKYEFTTNYLGAKVVETDDWCFTKKGIYIDKYGQGGDNCYQAYGISYWNEEDSKKLREKLLKVYNSRAGKEKFWDTIPLIINKKDFNVEIRECYKTDIVEIDNFAELVALDASYANYPGHDKF